MSLTTARTRNQPMARRTACLLTLCMALPFVAATGGPHAATSARLRHQDVVVARRLFNHKRQPTGYVLYSKVGTPAKQLFGPYSAPNEVGALSPNGRYLAYIDRWGTLRLASLTSGRVRSIRREVPESSIADLMAFSHDGRYLAYALDRPGGGLTLHVYDVRRRTTVTLAGGSSIGDDGMGATPGAAFAWAHHSDRILFTPPMIRDPRRDRQYRIGVSGPRNWGRIHAVWIRGRVGNYSPPAWSWNDRSLLYYAVQGSRIAVMEKPLGAGAAEQLALSEVGACTEVRCTAIYSEPVAMAHGVILCGRWDCDAKHVVAFRDGRSFMVPAAAYSVGNTPIFVNSTGTRALVLFGGSGPYNSDVAIWREGAASSRRLGKFAWAFWG